MVMFNGPATCENRSMDLFLVGGGKRMGRGDGNQKAEGGEVLNQPTSSQAPQVGRLCSLSQG